MSPSRKRLFPDYEKTPFSSNGEKLRQRVARELVSHAYVHAEIVSRVLVPAILRSETFLFLFTRHVAHGSALHVSTSHHPHALSLVLQQISVSPRTLKQSLARLSADRSTQTLRLLFT